MKMFLFAITITLSLATFAADQKVQLQTPRGTPIELDLYNVGKSNVLVMGPGQGCSARLDMYDALASEGLKNDFTVVRLYWSYCVTNPQQGSPAEDLSTEIEDYSTALNFVREKLGFTNDKIFLGGKSLGTLVTSAIFAQQPSFQGLLMLTPLCTDYWTDPNHHRNIFDETYPHLATESRPVLLAQGNIDPLCENPHFQDSLKNRNQNFVSHVVPGDHGLGVKKPDGTYDTDAGKRNLEEISSWLFASLKK